MNQRSLRISAVSMAAAFLIAAGRVAAQSVIVTGGPQAPEITVAPGDEIALVGSDASFSVTSGFRTYQWLHKGLPIKGETNSTLTLVDVQSDAAGYYSCRVNTTDGIVKSTEANLLVYTILDEDPIFVVFGQPIVGTGSSGTCPGKYAGYVNYTNGAAWGFTLATNTTVYTATDTNRTNTKVVSLGNYGDQVCAKTSITVPYPTFSPMYAFTIVFTNSVPTTNYPITLSGFNIP